MLRKGISEEETIKRTNVPNKAFPDALVMNYEGRRPYTKSDVTRS